MTVSQQPMIKGALNAPPFCFEVGFYFSCLIRNKSDLQNAKNRAVGLAVPDFLKKDVINESDIMSKKATVFYCLKNAQNF